MKSFLLFCLSLAAFSLAFSHPGIGIVKDSRGNIYYTDLKQIWKISTQGVKTVVVRGVHSHEIAIDANDNLYGEHLWYNGEALDTWGHYAWRLGSNGRLDTLIGPREGFLDDYSFRRDAAGNMYWIQQWKTARFKKRTIDGQVIVMAEKDLDKIGWMHVTAKGKIYFTDRKDLYQLDQQGNIRELAKKPAGKSSSPGSLWGIWTDDSNNIYVADMDSKKVIRIEESGKQTTVLKTSGAWFPLSGVFGNDGSLWLMEGNYANEVRVRRIEKTALASSFDGPSHTPVNKVNYFILLIPVVLVLSTAIAVNLRSSHRSSTLSI
jgi:hypothetical protein